MTLAASLATAIAVGLLIWLMGRSRAPQRPKTRREIPGLDVSGTRFWAVVLATSLVTFVIVLAVTGLVVVSAVPALVVATLPRTYLSRSRAKRIAAVQEAWPDGLRDILSSIRSGASLPTALEGLATFGPAPLRDAFQGFGVYARSLGVVPALEIIKEDLADPTSDRVIEVLILAYERGGVTVGEILGDLAEATTRDLWTMEQIRSEALEHKINSRVVFVLPWLVLIAMTARNGAFREFYSTPGGVMVVVAGGLLSLAGILIATRLGGSEDEPRVFGGLR